MHELLFCVYIILIFVIQLHDAESDDDIRNVFAMDEGLELLLSTGFRKAMSCLTLGDRSCITHALLDYHLMGRVKMEMDQFREGLEILGFLECVKKNSAIFRPFFVYTRRELTPGNMHWTT